MTRECSVCAAEISRKSKSGRCNSCSARLRMSQPGVAAAMARKRLEPAPDGFNLVAPVLTVSELRVRYGKGFDVIKRWCREAGLSPRRVSHTAGYKPAPVTLHIDQSIAGRAVEECLRKFGPVYRCAPTGRPDKTGTHWNRGGRVLTDEDVIDRAKRNGWSPTAWERIAA